MCGTQKLCVEFKGNLPKDLTSDLVLVVNDDEIRWSQPMMISERRGNNLTFLMPAFPLPQRSSARIILRLQYKQDILDERTYLYTQKIDGMTDKKFLLCFHFDLFFSRSIESRRSINANVEYDQSK